MPSPPEVLDQLRDILGRLVDADARRVVDEATLRDLGVDSLSRVEMAEELGRRFDTYLDDATVDRMRTVGDVVGAVADPPTGAVKDPAFQPGSARDAGSGSSPDHGPRRPAAAASASGQLTSAPPGPLPRRQPWVARSASAASPSASAGGRQQTTQRRPPAPLSMGTATSTNRRRHDQRSALWRLAGWFAAAGAAIGLVLGLGSSVLVQASGLGDVSLPPISQPSPSQTSEDSSGGGDEQPAASSSDGDSDEDQDKDKDQPKKNTKPKKQPNVLQAEAREVSAGELFALNGKFPRLGEGETLTVQVQDSGQGWDDFPVTAVTQAGGIFSTAIYTQTTGERKFRMKHVSSDATSQVVTVRIL